MSQAKNLAKLAQNITSQGVLNSAAVQGGGSGGGSSSPTITAIIYPGDDTAVSLAGGDTVTLNGTNFNTGVNVIVNNIAASVVNRISSTQVTFTAPPNPTGSYAIYVVNTDGTNALAVPGLQYSPVPVWTTSAGSLGAAVKSTNFSVTLASTGDGTITYSIASGTLPSGITLNSSTGVLSGTTPDVSTSTTYNFTLRSTDAQNQDTDRAFSLTIVPVDPTPTVQYLIVAGGGGSNGVGAGGAGGYRTSNSINVTPATEYVITVGAGAVANTNGSNSVFNSITAIGGGSGGWTTDLGSQAYGRDGGSGGGGSYGSPYTAQTRPGGAGTAGQGNNGGTGTLWAGGGGGGAGGVGGNATGSQGTAVGGAGGVGLQSSISGTATYYAGGGGGGCYSSAIGPAGSGGNGGGGNGAYSSSAPGTNGTANTGGGAGGGWAAANGGSGIVIIRYTDNYSIPSATTGSPTVTVSGGYRTYKFTSSGSITF